MKENKVARFLHLTIYKKNTDFVIFQTTVQRTRVLGRGTGTFFRLPFLMINDGRRTTRLWAVLVFDFGTLNNSVVECGVDEILLLCGL